MQITAFRGMKPFPQLLFSGFVILVIFFSFMLLSMLLAMPLFGTDSLLQITGIADLSDPESIRVLKYFQITQSFGLFIVPSLVLAWLFHGHVAEYLLLNKKSASPSVLMVVALVFFSLPFVNFIAGWNSRMQFPASLENLEVWMKNAEERAAALLEVFLKVDSIGGLLFNLFMIAVLAGIGEELLFRGVIQRIFTSWTRSHHWGVWISAILFSALHMQFYGFVPRMLLGVMFGYLLVWSGSMWLPVIAHIFFNAISVIGIHMIDKGLLAPEFEDIGSSPGSYYLAAISLALVLLLLLLIRNENRNEKLVLP
ncbi:MAG: CPBP family intramembrane glutamic endopeptidase [Mariniphaga sp.]|jgi:membrane protease YdiL (CAAX protease family)|nr:CPBP family intramembrane glutamic endopeptidase [Mariniphaga sp.]